MAKNILYIPGEQNNTPVEYNNDIESWEIDEKAVIDALTDPESDTSDTIIRILKKNISNNMVEAGAAAKIVGMLMPILLQNCEYKSEEFLLKGAREICKEMSQYYR